MKDERITSVENKRVVSDENKLLESFIKYCTNIFQDLGIDDVANISSDHDAATTWKPIDKYQNHPSIKVILKNVDTTNNFSFDLINPACISKIINNLDTSKDANQGDIPAKIIKVKVNRDLFRWTLYV